MKKLAAADALTAYNAEHAERVATAAVWNRVTNDAAGNVAAVLSGWTGENLGIVEGLAADGVDALAGDYA